ncbi:CinA family protein [Aliikangiella coralliicola]|uniref:CinA family protein n=1 Tax=Aliikangiella coralliicola TaxID=2592383 RepID=A0A545U4L5_9GAMM|nr:CinA family protein [Aliikangiella coralliicola]TQV84408.1 CinA family protein [Aliikangiella coralliicola]
MQKLVSQLSVRLIFKQLKVATVESCTGGWIGKILTDQAGSSEWFAGGLITYTNESKSQLADVPTALLDKYGAVSVEVAEAMAAGAQKHFPDCVSVAVSGVAGPGGGSKDKPVGTVCIATSLNGVNNARRYQFDGDRNQVRRETVKQALQMVLDALN